MLKKMKKKILVIRNDKLGDFMLAWPSFAMLKLSNPDYQITALVPPYTADIARICPYIDNIIIDYKNGNKEQQQATLSAIKQQQFNFAIALFSDYYNAMLLWRSKIPYTLAPATKLVQFLYRKRLVQRRSQSLKPEYEYNLDLIRYFLKDQQIKVIEPSPPYLTFSANQIAQQRQQLSQQLNLSQDKKWVLVHSGTGGSANNLSLAQYAELICTIAQQIDCQFILTAGPNEKQQAETLRSLTKLADQHIKVYWKNAGLADFALSLACSDLMIAGSTGPLHLAAAVNTLTIGFFPSKRSATALRWQPINQQHKHLSFTPDVSPSRKEKNEMARLDMQQVAQQAIPFILQNWAKTT